jgi:hypothetical protein
MCTLYINRFRLLYFPTYKQASVPCVHYTTHGTDDCLYVGKYNSIHLFMYNVHMGEMTVYRYESITVYIYICIMYTWDR